MTVIVGMETPDGVVIAGDSFAGNTYVASKVDTKVLRLKAGGRDLIAGYCGSFRFGQILRYRTQFPACPRNMDPDEYMAVKASDAIRKAVTDAGYLRKKDERESATGSGALIGYRGRLYMAQEDFDMLRVSNGYQCNGAGGDLAMGAMCALVGETTLGPVEIVTKAVEVACHHSPWCCLPVTMEMLKA